jgi:hypothetical protein
MITTTAQAYDYSLWLKDRRQMITYDRLQRRPTAAPSLIGMTVAEFDKLYTEFCVAHDERLSQVRLTRRTRTVRQRAVGAGRKHRYDLRDRLLMTLFWLRVYTTYEVMGFLYELNKTNIEYNLQDVLATLETMSTFTFERPGPERVKLRSIQAVMDSFPDVRLVIDAKEQRVQRPKSTKPRFRTLKTE